MNQCILTYKIYHNDNNNLIKTVNEIEHVNFCERITKIESKYSDLYMTRIRVSTTRDNMGKIDDILRNRFERIWFDF